MGTDSNSLHEILFNQIPDPVVIFDMKTLYILEFNQAMLVKYKYTRDELLSMRILDLHSPDDDIQRIEKNIHDSESDAPNKYTHLSKDGNKIYVETHTDYAEYNGRKVWITILRDISERIDGEQKLLKQQFYLKKAQEIGKIGTWEISRDSDEVTWTEGIYDIFGLPINQKISLDTIYNSIHPEDKDTVMSLWTLALSTGEFDCEYRIIINDEVKWIRNKAESSESIDKESSFIGVIQDITERKVDELEYKNARERYSAFINQSKIGIYRMEFEIPLNTKMDVQSQIDHMYEHVYVAECNKAFMKMYNISSMDEIVGKKLKELHGFDTEQNRAEAYKFITQGYIIEDEETKEYKVTGEIVWFSNYTIGIVKNDKLHRYWGTQIDITKSKILEENLIKNEEKLKEAQSIAKIGSWFIDLENDEYIWSDEMYRIYDYPKSKKLNFDLIRNMVVKEDLPVYDSAFELLENGELKEFTEHKIHTKNNELKYLLVRPKAEFDANNKLIRISGTTQDVTSLRIKETIDEARLFLLNFSLHNSSKQLIEETINLAEKITNSSFGFFHFFNTDQVEQYWSTKTIKTFESLNINPDLQDKNQLEIWEECIYKKAPLIYNNYNGECFNKIRLEHSLFIPILRGTRNLALLGVANKQSEYTRLDEELISKFADMAFDIVIRKKGEEILLESEAKYRSIVSESPIGIIYFDSKGILSDCNQSFGRIIGVHYEDLIGFNMLTQLQDDSLKEAVKEALTKGYSVFENWYNSITATKTSYVKVIFKGLKNNDGEIFAGIGLVEDITSTKEINDALIKAKDEAERSDRLKSDFLAQMSHEIRTPVNTILSYHSLIKEIVGDNDDEEIKDLFGGISSASIRLIRTIDLILNMAEVQSGSYHYIPNRIQLVEHILSVFSEMSHLAKSKKLEFNLDNYIDEKTFIHVDDYSFKQILANLIDNAIKYTKQGGVTVAIQEKNDCAYVKVIDTGIGVSEEYLNNIFEPFTQEEQGYTRRFEGTGLGLALVKKYCEYNNISISVESEKGKGTVFTLEIPIERQL